MESSIDEIMILKGKFNLWIFGSPYALSSLESPECKKITYVLTSSFWKTLTRRK